MAKLLIKMMLFMPAYLNQEKMTPEMNLQSRVAYYQTQKKTIYDVKPEYTINYEQKVKEGGLEKRLIPQKVYAAKPALSPVSTGYVAPNR